MPRVTMFDNDYVPMMVMDVREEDLRLLRANNGEYTEVAVIPSIPWGLNTAMNTAAAQIERTRAMRYRLQLMVEGFRWDDSVTRPILVTRGAHLRDLCQDGERIDRVCETILHGAIDRARRYGRDEERWVDRRAQEMRAQEMRNHVMRQVLDAAAILDRAEVPPLLRGAGGGSMLGRATVTSGGSIRPANQYLTRQPGTSGGGNGARLGAPQAQPEVAAPGIAPDGAEAD